MKIETKGGWEEVYELCLRCHKTLGMKNPKVTLRLGAPMNDEFIACCSCLIEMARGYDKILARLDALERK